ncbi:N protein [Chimay rhabdovirus]|uniref:N protein n=1 Tax=Chimay rhabdovirus TaxID=2116536 RepID=A0A2P1GJD1_9RHAB|nr:N protein [Chimay rhabdovirus]AVM86059.1 N protein [Chimay rhabdovirus]
MLSEVDQEMLEFEREVKTIKFKDPHLRGDGKWDWTDQAALRPFLTPNFTFKIPTPSKKRLFYAELLLAVLGDFGQVTDVVDLMMKAIYLSPNPEKNSEPLFPNLFSANSPNDIYEIPETTAAETLGIKVKTMGERYTDVLKQYAKTWTPPPPPEEDSRQAQLARKRAAGVSTMDPEAAVDSVATEITAQTKRAKPITVAPPNNIEAAFGEINRIWTAIHHDPPTEETRNAHQLLGFLSLVCSRLCVKEIPQVYRYFQVRASKAYVGTCNPKKLVAAIPVPCHDFLRQISQTFPKGSLRQRELFGYLVGARRAYDFINKPVDGFQPSQIKCGYLDAGCLIHLSMNGLGLISLLIGTSYELCAPIGWILQAITDSIAVNSARTAMKFLRMYHSGEEGQLTWQWSRLIDDGNFTSLALRNHLIFGSRLAAIYMIKSKDSGIWEMMAFSRISDGQRTAATDWGQKVVNYSQSTKADIGLTSLMKDILKHGESFTAPEQPSDGRDTPSDHPSRGDDRYDSGTDSETEQHDPTRTEPKTRPPPDSAPSGSHSAYKSLGIIIP